MTFSVAFARYLAQVCQRRSESVRLITDSPDHTRPIPSLRGPWVRQWHSEVDPSFGQSPVGACDAYLNGKRGMRGLGE